MTENNSENKVTNKLKKRRVKEAVMLNRIDPVEETRESIEKSIQLLTSALTLVAGLAWNDAIKNLINEYIQPALDSVFSQTLGDLAALIAPFIYAIIITIAVVFLLNRIREIEKKFKESAKEKAENEKSSEKEGAN